MVYRASSLRGLAIAQMVFGALMLVFGIASIAAVDRWISYVGFGIWVGIWVSTKFHARFRSFETFAEMISLSSDQEHTSSRPGQCFKCIQCIAVTYMQLQLLKRQPIQMYRLGYFFVALPMKRKPVHLL